MPAGTGAASDACLPLRRRNSSKIAAKISNSSTNAPTPTPTGSAQSESAVDVVKGDSEVTPSAKVVCTVVLGPALVFGVDEGIGPGGSVDGRGGTDVATVDVAGVVAVGVFGIEVGTVVTGELGVVVGVACVGGIAVDDTVAATVGDVTGELGVVVGVACVGGIAVDVTVAATVGDVMGELGVVVVGVDIAGAIDSCGAQHASICTRLASSLLAN